MRAFVAIPVPEDIRDRLEELQSDLPVGRLSDPGTFHVTLAFLGEEPVERIEAAHEALDRLAAAPFSLRIDGLDTFGGAAPRTLFAAIAPSAPLDALQRKVRSLLHGAGIMPDRTRFRPHVTLARFRPGSGIDAALARFLTRHATFGTAPFPVTEVVLYRSHLTGDGAIHEALAEYPL
ncbi:RNA 2',3'-cyclic phosphodiesterase [Defluviimonas sp. SAOS-178_SWC]|uniref:RNA 2',3'-cyclic phosphodiesterase n=1 Tax=Defluviimonas sp. SAOS-178_SWC TaxID=3121287 RepID=UPI003222112D